MSPTTSGLSPDATQHPTIPEQFDTSPNQVTSDSDMQGTPPPLTENQEATINSWLADTPPEDCMYNGIMISDVEDHEAEVAPGEVRSL